MSNVMGPDNAQEKAAVLEQMVLQYQQMLLRLCYLHLQDRTLAEDAGNLCESVSKSGCFPPGKQRKNMADENCREYMPGHAPFRMVPDDG